MTSGNSLWVRTKENARRRRWLWIGNCFVFFMWMPIRFLAMCSSLQRNYGTNAGDIFEHRIEPLLREYTRGRDNEKVNGFIKTCRTAFLKSSEDK